MFSGKGPFVADCQLKGNRGLAQKRKPHDSCFASKHLNNEELSWGKNTLPKLTEKSWSGFRGKNPSGALPSSSATAQRPFQGKSGETPRKTAGMMHRPLKGGPTGVPQKIRTRESGRLFLPHYSCRTQERFSHGDVQRGSLKRRCRGRDQTAFFTSSRLVFQKYYLCTYDQGREFFNDKQTDHHFGTASSFRHAGCPGERGLNERTNGLLRQFFPRTRNFRGLGEHETARAVAFITHRPRKKSGDRTTVEKMREDGVFLVSTFV